MDVVALTLLGMVLLTVEHALPPVFGTAPNLVVPLVLVLAWRRPTLAGALAAFVLGYLGDLYAGAPPGAGAFALVAVFVAARPVLAQMEYRGLWRPALLGAFAAAAAVGLAGAARWALAGGSMVGALYVLAPRAALTAVCAPLVAWLALRLQTSLGPAAARRDRPGAALPGARRRAGLDLALR
jgi:rod shape-determining protein MreD